MPKFCSVKIDDDVSNEPPCNKKIKIEISGEPQTHQQKRSSIRNHHQNQDLPLNLGNLPTEILEKIIGYANIWEHTRIRVTSKRMKDFSDFSIMHQFRKVLAKHLRQNPCSKESAVLKTIKLATEVYVRSGFESLFCGCILPMLCSLPYKHPFCLHTRQINRFLLHFFRQVENRIGDPTSQKLRLLYNLTLLRLLKAFNNSAVITSRSYTFHWRTVIQLRGSWLGTVYTSQTHGCKQHHLLVILSELLMANIAGRQFQRDWKCGSEIYVFGNDIRNRRNVPRTLFTITVHGSEKIPSLLRKCLEDDPSEFTWPTKWPNDQFTVNVDICSKEATKWGCSKSQHLEFSPFVKQTFSENDLNSITSGSSS